MISGGPSPSVWQNAEIVSIVEQTHWVKSFLFRPASPFVHIAGQHVDLRLTAPDGYQAMRSYSIASAPSHTGLIELVIERLETGEVSGFFHDVAQIGDTIEMRGPLGGHFIWRDTDGGPLLLIAGGSGVAPLASMLRYSQSHPIGIEVALLYSARTWDEIIFREELVDLQAQRPGPLIRLALTRQPTSHNGVYDRRIDTLMISDMLSQLGQLPAHVFICGSNAFVNAAAESVLTLAIDTARIRTERYGGS